MNTKILIGGIVAIVIGVLAYSFVLTPQDRADSDAVTVAATIPPVYSLVSDIAGDNMNVELILPAGTSPHVYEVRPSTLRKLRNVSAVFAIGHGIDTWANPIVEAANDATIVPLDGGIALIESEEHDEHGEDEHHDEDEHEDEHGHGHDDDHEDEHADDHDHGGIDPHYWLSPENAIIMIDEIVEHLGEIDPANAEEYAVRGAELEQEINTNMVTWKGQIAALANKNLVTFHDAFGYFADTFGLDVVATFEPFPGKQPTPQYLAALREEIKEKNIKTLYIEPQLSKDALETFAQDEGLAIGVLDPLGGVEGRESYIELIDYNISTIIETNR